MIPKIYLVVTPFFPSASDWRGAYILDQVKAIQRNSTYEVIVYKSGSACSKYYSYEIDGVKVHCVNTLLMPSYILNGLTESLIGKQFVKQLLKIGIDLSRIAFVHCHTTNHAAFGFGVKNVNPEAKVLVQFHDLDPLTLRNGKWAEKQWNRRYRASKSIETLNKSDLLICISEPVRDALMSFPKPRKGEVFESAIRMLDKLNDLPSVKPKNVYILNNGVDTKLFYPKDKPNNSSVYRIGCIANFQSLKDHETLVKAFNILVKKGHTNMRLSLLGSGETKDSIRHLIVDNGLSDFTEWPTEVPHEQLPDYYRSLNIFVLPSRYEGFGCVYTEAAACGIPFICCENQGASECINTEDSSKWLISDRDYVGLAKIIEDHYKNNTTQYLVKDIDIDILITKFLSYLENTFSN